MRQQSKVVGMTFRNKGELFTRLRPSGLVHLVPDPDNEFDKNGLAVEVRIPHPENDGEFVHIGFLPANDKDAALTEANIQLQREVHEAYDNGEKIFAAVLQYSYFDADIGFNDEHIGRLQSCLLYVSDDIDDARDGYRSWVEFKKKKAKAHRQDERQGGSGEVASKKDDVTVTGTHYVKGRKKFRRITNLLSCYEADGKEGFDRIIKWAMEQGVQGCEDDLVGLLSADEVDHKAVGAVIHKTYLGAFDGTATAGTDIHKSIELWLGGDKEQEVPQGFLNWAKKYNPEVLGLEETQFDKELGVAGTYDARLRVTFTEKGKQVTLVANVDWKSSKAVRSKHKTQAGFNTHLDEQADEGWVVVFGSDAKQGYSMNRQTREECAKQYEKVMYLVAMQTLDGK